MLLTNPKVEELMVAEVAFQMVANVDRTDAGRCTRIKHVTHLKGEEAADVADELIHLIEHIACVARLYRLAVDVKVKVKVLNIHQPFSLHSPSAALLSKALDISQGWPLSFRRRCKSRAVKSMPTLTAS